MNPVEKLISSVMKIAESDYKVGEDLKAIVMEYLNAPKDVGFPWKAVIPEWVQWAAVDDDGSIYFYEKKPEINDMSMSWLPCVNCNAVPMGKVSIDIDWKEARWHREGEEWVQE